MEKRSKKQKEPIVSKEVGKGAGNVKVPELIAPVEIGKISSMFNLQSELSKLNN